MNRYAFLLNKENIKSKTIGLFPWGTIIDNSNSDINKNLLIFTESGIEFLKSIASTTSVVLFVNQFKTRPLSMEDFQDLINTIENFVKEQGVNVIGTYWAPGTQKNDPFVVPNPGMFYRVSENTSLNWEGVEVLSSSDDDLSAAKKVKATPIKIGSSHKIYQSFKTVNDWLSP